MKKKIFPVIAVLLISIVATSCGLVAKPTVAPQIVTPNATLTALFDTNSQLATVTPMIVVVTNTPEAATPQYIIVTNTPEPTAVPPTATATSAYTATPVATSTSTVPPLPASNRTGADMKAGYISTAPTIDGSWAEWKDYATQYTVSAITYGRSHWTGASDLEGSFAAAWDYNYLYLGVKVHDDIHAQNATGENIFKGDSIELLLDKDLMGDYYTHGLSGDDYQLGVSAGNSSAGIPASAYMWFPSGSAGVKSNVTIGYLVEDSNIYRYEVQIPWSVFGINPTAGMKLGICVSISDNDDVNQNLQQSLASSSENRSLVDPTKWGTIVLSK
jgi:hypothetical protein